MARAVAAVARTEADSGAGSGGGGAGSGGQWRTEAGSGGQWRQRFACRWPFGLPGQAVLQNGSSVRLRDRQPIGLHGVGSVLRNQLLVGDGGLHSSETFGMPYFSYEVILDLYYDGQ